MTRSPAGTVVGAALGLGVPVALFSVLNALRPDLMQPMLGHVFGYVFVAVVFLLSLIATTLYGVALGLEFKSAASRVVLIVCAVVFCTIPSIVLVLLGPVVFAFMYGNPG